MGTGSFPGVKRPGRGVDHPSPPSAEVKEKVELPLLSLWAFVACYRVNFTFTYIIIIIIIIIKFSQTHVICHRLPSPVHPYPLWVPPNLLFNEYQLSLMRVKRLRREAGYSYPSFADIMNEWSYTAVPHTRLHGL